MQLTKKEYDAIQLQCNHYKNNRAAIVEALKIVQKNRGWVSDESIVWIAEALQIPESDIEGVATFYNQIFRQPVGKYIIRYCDSVVCYITGCEKIKKTLESFLKIEIGNTTQDKKFTLLPTCCVGMCNLSPIIMVNTNIYANVISSEIVKILRSYQ